MESMTRFNKDMSILEALEQHPQARSVFEGHGMACCLCIGAQLESVEAGAIMHAVDPDEVVDELNALPEPESPGATGA
jgi:hybrid cluster-associated redox disulfide protein